MILLCIIFFQCSFFCAHGLLPCFLCCARPQPLLSSLPSPVTIDFLRRVPISSAPSSTTSKNSSKLKQPRPSPLTHAEVTERHRDLQPVLRGVSGSTVSSLTPALVSSSGSSTSGNVGRDGEHIRPLKPMMCGIMGPSGAGKTSLLDCLVRRCKCIFLYL